MFDHGFEFDYRRRVSCLGVLLIFCLNFKGRKQLKLRWSWSKMKKLNLYLRLILTGSLVRGALEKLKKSSVEFWNYVFDRGALNVIEKLLMFCDQIRYYWKMFDVEQLGAASVLKSMTEQQCRSWLKLLEMLMELSSWLEFDWMLYLLWREVKLYSLCCFEIILNERK
jgi:hypothetical protein